MGRSDESSADQNVMQFRVERVALTDAVPGFTPANPDLRGQYLVWITDDRGPATPRLYPPEEIVPHLDTIQEAITSRRVYAVETDATERTWPHHPDPRGRIDQRIVRAIVARPFSEDDPIPQ